MFTKPLIVGTAALLVAITIVAGTGCSATPRGFTTTPVEHLVEQGTSNERGVDAVAPAPSPTPVATTPVDGTVPEPHADPEADLTTGTGVELDTSDLDALLKDLDGLVGDIDNEIGQLGDSFDHDEGDVEK